MKDEEDGELKRKEDYFLVVPVTEKRVPILASHQTYNVKLLYWYSQ